jgi:uncharacterized membrane protein
MKLVKRLMKEDLSKQEIFERASEEGLNLKKVSKYLAMYPDPEESKKYNKANRVLIGIYAALVILSIIGAISMVMDLPPAAILGVLAFSLLIPGVVIYCIYKKQSIGYLILCFFLLKGIIDIFKDYQADPAGVWLGAGISLCLIVYVVVLKNKMFPHQNFFNTKKNSDGISVFTKDLTNQVVETL